MAKGDTSIGGPDREFPSTGWSTILGAGNARDEERRRFLERLIQRYWKPVYSYFRAAGRRAVEDAKDLTQSFFARMLEKDYFSRLDPERGSFRAFLRKSIRNFLVDDARREQARRPREGAHLFTFEEEMDREIAGDGQEDPEAAFDREWRRTLVRASIDGLREMLNAKKRAKYFDIFRLYCLDDTGSMREGGGGPTYKEVGDDLGFTEAEVRKRLSYCRQKLRDIMLERIREYVTDEREAAEEFEGLLQG